MLSEQYKRTRFIRCAHVQNFAKLSFSQKQSVLKEMLRKFKTNKLFIKLENILSHIMKKGVTYNEIIKKHTEHTHLKGTT